MDSLITFPNTAQVLGEYAKFIEDQYKRNLEMNGHKATGKLISSVHTVVNIGDKSMSVDMYLEDYYKYVEKGRNRGKMPPVNAILDWVKVKLNLPTEKQNGVAWAIAKNMEKIGSPSRDSLPVEPTYDLKTAKETTDNLYWAKIEQALQKDLKENLTSIASILIV